MPYNSPEAKKNLQIGITKMETAMDATAKVRRRFKGGRLRATDTIYDTENAVLQARIALLAIRRASVEEGALSTESDLRVALALISPGGATTDLVALIEIPRSIDQLPKAYAEAHKLEDTGGFVPLGLTFWQRDIAEIFGPSSVGHGYTWTQAWLVGPRAKRAAAAAETAYKKTHGEETTTTF